MITNTISTNASHQRDQGPSLPRSGWIIAGTLYVGMLGLAGYGFSRIGKAEKVEKRSKTHMTDRSPSLPFEGLTLPKALIKK